MRYNEPFPNVISGIRKKYSPHLMTFVSSRSSLLISLQLEIALLEKRVLSNETPRKTILLSLCIVLTKAINLANSYGSLSIPNEMSRRYSVTSCDRFKETCCECTPLEAMMLIVESEIDPMQTEWSIFQWCRFLRKRYGKVNSRLGVHTTVTRLYSKVGATQLLPTEESASEYRARISKSFADLFVRIFNIAALLDVNLDSKMKQFAFGKCSGCKKNPCDCGFPNHMS